MNVDYKRALSYPSSNYNQRPDGMPISAIVLHATVGELGPSLSWLANQGSYVSVHYVVSRDGLVYQMVPESLRAWHAGPSQLGGLSDWNNFSVGIEIVNLNDGIDPYLKPQTDAVASLVKYLVSKYKIESDRIVTHAMISGKLTGKTDPRNYPLQELLTSVYDDIPVQIRYIAWRLIGTTPEYNPDAALLGFAKANDLGHPVTVEHEETFSTGIWIVQGYHSKIVCCLKGDWGNIRTIDWY